MRISDSPSVEAIAGRMLGLWVLILLAAQPLLVTEVFIACR
jgi:hypothetical protein